MQRTNMEAAADYLYRPFLPYKISSHTQRILIHSYDLIGSQDLKCALAELAQVGSNEQGGLEQAPEGKVAPLLILQQARVAHLPMCCPIKGKRVFAA